MSQFQVTDEIMEEAIQSLQRLINIPSIKESSSPSAPFGKSINDALVFVLDLAKHLGFYTKNLDGYMGIVEMGEGEEELGILVHIDVVPTGDESMWRFPPFSGEIASGSI